MFLWFLYTFSYTVLHCVLGNHWNISQSTTGSSSSVQECVCKMKLLNVFLCCLELKLYRPLILSCWVNVFFFIIRYWSVNVVNMSPPSKGCSLVKHFVCCCNCPTLELAIMTDAALGHIFNMYNMSKQFFSPLCHGCDSVSTCRTAWADPLT